MAGRIRSIKPEWIEDERLNACSDAAIRLTFVFLAMVDDDGRCRVSMRALGMAGWKFCDSIPDKTAHARSAVAELVAAGWLVQYEADGYEHWQIRNFSKHQKISHYTASKLPSPPESSVAVQPTPEPSGVLRSSPEPAGVLRPDLEGIRSGSGSGVGGEPESARARVTAAAASPGTEAMLRSLIAPTSAEADIAAIVSETRQAAGGAKFRPTSFADREAVQKLAEWVKATETPPDVLRALLAAFWGSKGTSARLSWLTEEDPGRYLGTKPPAKVKGQAPPATHAEHAAAVAQAIAEGRPHGEGWADVGI